MTTKSDFTEEEWSRVVRAPFVAGMAITLADPGGPRPIDSREDATTAVSALCAAAGAWGVRVHTVTSSVDAVRVAAATTGRGPITTLPGCLDGNSRSVR